MASKRAVAPLLSSRSIASTPRAAHHAPLLRAIPSATAARSQPWAALQARTQLSSIPQTRLFSSSTTRPKESTSSNPEATTPFKQWSFEDINTLLTSPTTTPTILIDVREPTELRTTGIIPTALAMPLNSQPDALFLQPDEFLTRFGYPKPGAPQVESEADSPASGSASKGGEEAPTLVFYCRAGVRARTAAELAVQAGYDRGKVGVYDGSWLDWEKRQGKVEKWDG